MKKYGSPLLLILSIILFVLGIAGVILHLAESHQPPPSAQIPILGPQVVSSLPTLPSRSVTATVASPITAAVVSVSEIVTRETPIIVELSDDTPAYETVTTGTVASPYPFCRVSGDYTVAGEATGETVYVFPWGRCTTNEENAYGDIGINRSEDGRGAWVVRQQFANRVWQQGDPITGMWVERQFVPWGECPSDANWERVLYGYVKVAILPNGDVVYNPLGLPQVIRTGNGNSEIVAEFPQHAMSHPLFLYISCLDTTCVLRERQGTFGAWIQFDVDDGVRSFPFRWAGEPDCIRIAMWKSGDTVYAQSCVRGGTQTVSYNNGTVITQLPTREMVGCER